MAEPTAPAVTEDDVVEQHDPTHNRSYFVNKRTGKSGWTREEVLDQVSGANGSSATGAASVAHDGLQERTDATTGRLYYVHTRTGKTGWTREAALEAAGVTVAAAPTSTSGAEVEIEERFDATHKRTFYVNLHTGKSAWTRKGALEQDTDGDGADDESKSVGLAPAGAGAGEGESADAGEGAHAHAQGSAGAGGTAGLPVVVDHDDSGSEGEAEQESHGVSGSVSVAEPAAAAAISTGAAPATPAPSDAVQVVGNGNVSPNTPKPQVVTHSVVGKRASFMQLNALVAPRSTMNATLDSAIGTQGRGDAAATNAANDDGTHAYADADTLEFVSLRGVMDKTGPRNSKWNKGRYFVLERDTLAYFKDERAFVQNPSRRKGTVHLSADTKLRRQVDGNAPTGFQIVTRSRTWNFQTASTDEMQQWLRALRTNIAVLRHDTEADERPSMGAEPPLPPSAVAVATAQASGSAGANDVVNLQRGVLEFGSFQAKLKHEWEVSDSGHGLTKKDVRALMQRLNAKISVDVVETKFAEFDADGSGRIEYDEFCALFKASRSVPRLEHLLRSYATGGGVGGGDGDVADSTQLRINAAGLRQFLLEMQHDDGTSTAASLDHCAHLIARFAHTSSSAGGSPGDTSTAPSLCLDGFTDFLTDPETNGIFDPAQTQPNQPRDRPLSHYFVSSSHNTYLSGNQLTSKSTADAIVHALRMGVRVVELDCYDGSNGMPRVMHGGTMTKAISFVDCIAAVATHAFSATDAPCIVTLDNHCSPPQQRTQAQLLRNILGRKLYVPPAGSDSSISLPSLEAVRGKVLIRDKPRVIEAQELLDLIAIRNVSFAGLGSDDTSLPATSSSFDEDKIVKLSGSDHGAGQQQLQRHTSRHMVRVYPAGTRIMSSNYDPQLAWCCGCQMAALNYQAGDKAVWLNQGKFAANGGCGWVLKPQRMLEATPAIQDVDLAPAAAPIVPVTLQLTIVSGHYLPKPYDSTRGEIIDPFVFIQIAGARADMAEAKTRTVNDNGFDPEWTETFEFHITEPDIAVVLFAVYDQDVAVSDDFIGQYALPVSCMRQGFRCVPLKRANGTPHDWAYLFCKIELVQGS